MARINLAIDHVVAHLAEPLHLSEVAHAAQLSPFHFHRVFRALTGEPLNQFVKRLRLERALSLLARDHGGRRTLTDVALASGFASSQDFSRCFKQRYGVPPSRFDLAQHRARQREALQSTVPGGDPLTQRPRLERLPRGANPDRFEVTLRQLPPRSVAYIRVHDSYRPGAALAAVRRLMAWADQQGVGQRQWLGYMWDDPEVVALKDCRYDAAVTIEAEDRVQVGGEIGRYDFPAMQVAQVEVRGGIDLELRALDWLFGSWLSASGFVPAELPCFEAWMGRPFKDGMAWFELWAWLPVERGLRR